MNNKKYIVLIIVLSSILIGIFLFIPFEQFIFRFDTPEEAMKFDYIEGVKEIVSTIKNGDYAEVIYVDRTNKLHSKYLIRDKRGWISPIKQSPTPNKFKITFDYSIVGYHKKGKNLLVIQTSKYKEERKMVENIYDNIGTEFVMKEFTYDEIHYREWIGIIDKYPKDYKLYLDDKEISI